MQLLHRRIERLAPTDAGVLIEGESGTGKELVAHAIHQQSRYASGPLIAVHCAALPEALFESELFGHERGAFTGAIQRHKGRFELADGGSLFLDEIGEAPLSIQTKLLRVLQEHEFERVGGTTARHVQVRIISATNKSLDAEVQRGSFRADLYYRLRVVDLHVPSLRERRDDIRVLADCFLKQCAEENPNDRSFSEEALQWMENYPWPGNVRELEHAVRHLSIMGSGTIRVEELRDVVATTTPRAATTHGSLNYREAINRARREVVQLALGQSAGVSTEAARLLGLHPVHLSRLIQSLNIRRPNRP